VAQQAPTQRPARPNLEKIVKAPNGRNIAVKRDNPNARWNFKNNANKMKYNLSNRFANVPTVYEVNVGSGNLFKTNNSGGGVPTARALAGFANPTLPQTPENQRAIVGTLKASNTILKLPNENISKMSVNNLRSNMNSLKNTLRRLRPGFSNNGVNLVNRAAKRLAAEINQRGLISQ
jgi:hypothetical protein